MSTKLFSNIILKEKLKNPHTKFDEFTEEEFSQAKQFYTDDKCEKSFGLFLFIYFILCFWIITSGAVPDDLGLFGFFFSFFIGFTAFWFLHQKIHNNIMKSSFKSKPADHIFTEIQSFYVKHNAELPSNSYEALKKIKNTLTFCAVILVCIYLAVTNPSREYIQLNLIEEGITSSLITSYKNYGIFCKATLQDESEFIGISGFVVKF